MIQANPVIAHEMQGEEGGIYSGRGKKIRDALDRVRKYVMDRCYVSIFQNELKSIQINKGHKPKKHFIVDMIIRFQRSEKRIKQSITTTRRNTRGFFFFAQKVEDQQNSQIKIDGFA